MFNPLPPNPGGFTWTGSPSGVPSWDATSAISPQAALAQASVPNGAGAPASNNAGQQQAAQDVARWEQYMATIQQAMQASAGFERVKLQEQYKDAEKGRQNAMAIARLQSDTSRYGYDQQRQSQIDDLKERGRQFDANHALAQQEFGLKREQFTEDTRRFGLEHGLKRDQFGLEVADAYTRYSQTPDMMFARNDLMHGLGQVGLGGAPQNVMSGDARPQAKGWEDFAALSGYKVSPSQANPLSSPGGAMMPAPIEGRVVSASSTPMPSGGMGTGQAGSGTDPRVTAAAGIMRALPPSETPGTDGQDWSALRAIESLYMSRKPRQVEALGDQRRKTAQAGLARLGYDPRQVEEDRQRSLPGQRSVRAA